MATLRARELARAGRGVRRLLPPRLRRRRSVDGGRRGGRFRGSQHELSYEFDEYAPFAEARPDAGEVSLAREESSVNGRPAVFQTVRTANGTIFSGVHFALTAEDAGKPLALTIFGTCATVEACADVWVIGRTAEIY